MRDLDQTKTAKYLGEVNVRGMTDFSSGENILKRSVSFKKRLDCGITDPVCNDVTHTETASCDFEQPTSYEVCETVLNTDNLVCNDMICGKPFDDATRTMEVTGNSNLGRFSESWTRDDDTTLTMRIRSTGKGNDSSYFMKYRFYVGNVADFESMLLTYMYTDDKGVLALRNSEGEVTILGKRGGFTWVDQSVGFPIPKGGNGAGNASMLVSEFQPLISVGWNELLLAVTNEGADYLGKFNIRFKFKKCECSSVTGAVWEGCDDQN
jgi:hypothetical protein